MGLPFPAAWDRASLEDVGFEGFIPIGVQVIGAKFDDRGVLRILKQIESARVGWPGWPVGGGRRS